MEDTNKKKDGHYGINHMKKHEFFTSFFEKIDFTNFGSLRRKKLIFIWKEFEKIFKLSSNKCFKFVR